MQSCHQQQHIFSSMVRFGLGLAVACAAWAPHASWASNGAGSLAPALAACQDRRTNLWGLCRNDGSAAPPIVPQRFSFIGAAGGGTEGDRFPARAQPGDLLGYIDSKGDWAVKPQFSQALPFSEGLAVVSDGEKSGAIDRTGHVVVPWFDGLMYPYSQGLACVVPGGSIRMGLPGRIRQKLLGRLGDDPYPAPWWELKGQVGFVDTSGRMVISPRFEPKLNFLTAGCGFSTSGYAAVREAGKEGLIDARGKWVVEPLYDYVGMVFSGNRKVVALIAERLVRPGIFLDTIERLDGSMVPGQPVRWRETGATQEAMVSGGLFRVLLNHFLFPRWQQDLLNDGVSSHTLSAWLGSVVIGIAMGLTIFLRSHRRHAVIRAFVSVVAGVAAVVLSFVAGLVSLYLTSGLLMAAATIAVRKWRTRKSGRRVG